MNLAAIASWALAVPILPVLGVFLTEALAGLPRLSRSPQPVARMPRTVILMPAHNEEAGIARTIASVLKVAPDALSILVVADNCTDRTAPLAREAGAEVIERHDLQHRGKGYALAFGCDHLRADSPECVVILDADCAPTPGSLATLAKAAVLAAKPVQATNLIEPDLGARPMVQISNFAFLVKNLIRQRGAARIGAAAVLTGTGMAFPWPAFSNAALASGDIVEDLALGIGMMREGHVPRFVEGAMVTSEAASERDTITQRTRWEHGFVKTALRWGLPLLGEGVVKRNWPIFWMGLHLLVPPLALLFGAAFALATLLFLAGLLAGAGFGAFFAVSGLLGTAAAVVVAAWLVEGRKVLSFGTLLRVPLYVLWKIPVYLRLVGGGETRWIRTNRPGD